MEQDFPISLHRFTAKPGSSVCLCLVDPRYQHLNTEAVSVKLHAFVVYMCSFFFFYFFFVT